MKRDARDHGPTTALDASLNNMVDLSLHSCGEVTPCCDRRKQALHITDSSPCLCACHDCGCPVCSLFCAPQPQRFKGGFSLFSDGVTYHVQAGAESVQIRALALMMPATDTSAMRPLCLACGQSRLDAEEPGVLACPVCGTAERGTAERGADAGVDAWRGGRGAEVERWRAALGRAERYQGMPVGW